MIAKCCYCDADIDDKVHRYFWEQLPKLEGGTYFEWECPECGKGIEVEVIPCPEFKIHKKEV